MKLHDGAVKRPLPLAGVKVLDISQVMAGPYACMLLADLGADVIKIEPPGSGDQTRGAMGFKMKGPDSMGFLNMNRNKRSVGLRRAERNQSASGLHQHFGFWPDRPVVGPTRL